LYVVFTCKGEKITEDEVVEILKVRYQEKDKKTKKGA
jgi:uncharacterized protein YrzB (UPF0473 family)